MKKKYYDGGGEVDPMEAANASQEAMDISSSMEAGPKNEEMPKAEKPKNRVVSKKELEESGMSLRDYLNRERGLKRRKDEAKKEEPKKEKYETPYDRMNRTNKESGIDFDSMIGKLKDRITNAPNSGQDRILTGMKKNAGTNAGMGGTGMKSGGSVSSASRRADGIATKGKTKGTMVAMCGGGMYKVKK
jgi:hypothetical protein